MNNWTNIDPITLPSGWDYQATSDGLIFMISTNKLYKFNSTTGSYDPMYNFSTNTRYSVFSNLDRVVVTSSNSSVGSSSADYAIHILHAKDSGAVLISTFSINGINEATNPLDVKVSANLTKVFLVY